MTYTKFTGFSGGIAGTMLAAAMASSANAQEAPIDQEQPVSGGQTQQQQQQNTQNVEGDDFKSYGSFSPGIGGSVSGAIGQFCNNLKGQSDGFAISLFGSGIAWTDGDQELLQSEGCEGFVMEVMNDRQAHEKQMAVLGSATDVAIETGDFTMLGTFNGWLASENADFEDAKMRQEIAAACHYATHDGQAYGVGVGQNGSIQGMFDFAAHEGMIKGYVDEQYLGPKEQKFVGCAQSGIATYEQEQAEKARNQAEQAQSGSSSESAENTAGDSGDQRSTPEKRDNDGDAGKVWHGKGYNGHNGPR